MGMCTPPSSFSWLEHSQCTRAVIIQMGPFLVKKLLLTATLTPFLELLKMRLSVAWKHHRSLVAEVHAQRIKVSMQIAQIMTWFEMAMVWGPLVPALYPCLFFAMA